MSHIFKDRRLTRGNRVGFVDVWSPWERIPATRPSTTSPHGRGALTNEPHFPPGPQPQQVPRLPYEFQKKSWPSAVWITLSVDNIKPSWRNRPIPMPEPRFSSGPRCWLLNHIYWRLYRRLNHLLQTDGPFFKSLFQIYGSHFAEWWAIQRVTKGL